MTVASKSSDFKTALNIFTAPMALSATIMGLWACIGNKNYNFDNYIFISIYGLEGIFLLSE